MHLQTDRPWAAAQQALKGSATFIVGRANSVALAPEVDDTVERNPRRRHGGLARLVAPQVGLPKPPEVFWGCLAQRLTPPWGAFLPVCLPPAWAPVLSFLSPVPLVPFHKSIWLAAGGSRCRRN